MTTKSDDWNPRAEQVLDDPLHAYDRMRKQCPVAYSDYLQWSLFRHQDISQVLHDHNTFSSTVSAHVSVPNSMDPPEHTVYRAIIEPYFSSTPYNALNRCAGIWPTNCCADYQK